MSESWLHDQLRRHTERFRCAICGVPSRRPAYETLDGAAHSWSDWNRPGDLHWCRDCGRYACARHYSPDRGYCSECNGEALPCNGANGGLTALPQTGLPRETIAHRRILAFGPVVAARFAANPGRAGSAK